MLKKFLRKISEQIENRLLTLHWRHLLYGAITGVVTFGLVTLIAGILQEMGLDFWKVSILPWINTEETVSHGSLTIIGLGWLLSVMIFLASWGWYGLYSRAAGQLERIERERLCELTPKEAKSHAVLDAIDRELFVYLTDPSIPHNEDAVKRFVEAIVERTFEIWGADKVFRAAVYLPKRDDSDYLTTECCDEGIGDKHSWYIGNIDDPSIKGPRGIPGSVYRSMKSRVDIDIRDDPDFHNWKKREREELPHLSAVYALIHPDNKEKRAGVFCLESESYTFDEYDLALVEPVATRLAWLLEQKVVEERWKRILSKPAHPS
jgi:hypothetical protein